MQTSPGIVWLASYPKSGNTWFRMFLTALFKREIDINDPYVNIIYSDRTVFENFTGLDDSRLLYDSEAKKILPGAFDFYAGQVTEPTFIKIHDAYTRNENGAPIVPGHASKAVIYIVRNPLDIVCSLASHISADITSCVNFVNSDYSFFAAQENNHNTRNQFPQLLLKWSRHVESWTKQEDIPVLVIRYEDLLTGAAESFKRALAFIGLTFTDEEIALATESCRFSLLKEQEERKGFKERPVKNENTFFRKGTAGNWMEELTPEHIQQIVQSHCEVMQRYGYTDHPRLIPYL